KAPAGFPPGLQRPWSPAGPRSDVEWLLDFLVHVRGAGGLHVTRGGADLALPLEGRVDGVAVQVAEDLGGKGGRCAGTRRAVLRHEVVRIGNVEVQSHPGRVVVDRRAWRALVAGPTAARCRGLGERSEAGPRELLGP